MWPNWANLHPDTISRLERGAYNDSVPLSTLIDIADALGIDVAPFAEHQRG